MKQKLLTKYILIGIVVFSLFSFFYVNLHAAYTGRINCDQQVKSPQPVLVEEEDKQKNDIPIPDVTVISRVIELVQKFASSSRF